MSLRVLASGEHVPVQERDSNVARVVRSATDGVRIMDSAAKVAPLAGCAPSQKQPRPPPPQRPNPMDVPVHAQQAQISKATTSVTTVTIIVDATGTAETAVAM